MAWIFYAPLENYFLVRWPLITNILTFDVSASLTRHHRRFNPIFFSRSWVSVLVFIVFHPLGTGASFNPSSFLSFKHRSPSPLLISRVLLFARLFARRLRDLNISAILSWRRLVYVSIFLCYVVGFDFFD